MSALLLAAAAAAPGLLSAAGQGVGSLFSKAARERRKLHKQDLADLNAGRLGYSAGKKSAMVEQAAKNIRAETAGVGNEISQSIAAQGGVGRSGHAQSSLRDLAKTRADAIAAARGQAAGLSETHAQAREAQIRGDTTQLAQEQQARGERIGGSLGQAAGAAAGEGLKGISRAQRIDAAIAGLNLSDEEAAKKRADLEFASLSPQPVYQMPARV